MSFQKARRRAGQNHRISGPDIAPFAGIILLLVALLLLDSSPKLPRTGIVALEDLPHSSGLYCTRGLDNVEVLISLNDQGHFSFAISDSILQNKVLQQVSTKHQITLSAPQVAELKFLPFLATNVEQLPGILSPLGYKRFSTPILKANNTLSEAQLLECVFVTKQIAPFLLGRQVSFSLFIDAETSASKVMHLLKVLQIQEINRFNLRVQYI